MIAEQRVVKLADVVFAPEFYPRRDHNPALVQQYAATLSEIEARNNFISISTDGTLLDGRHRHLAYLKNHDGRLDVDVPVYSYDVTEAKDKFALAVELNSSHGHQLSPEDKRSSAIHLYNRYHFTLDDIARLVSARKQVVLDWTKSIREEEERRANEDIFALFLACHTNEQIAKATGLETRTVTNKIERLLENEFPGTKLLKLSRFDDADEGFAPPIYNVWGFAKKTNEVAHFGNSEQRIVDNLLYLYTEPFDIVLDPFAGGGSTIDVCKRRLRRYWVSDRKPIVERAQEIRPLDIAKDLPPLHNRWSDVALTYLDPPYWRQAAGKYSDDAADLANMPLDQFTAILASVVKRISAKQRAGSVIALLIQPTQWSADDRQYTDHVTDLVRAVGTKRLVLENRVSVPYATEQYNAQQVEWAKANKKLLVITRELIIWRIQA